MSKPILPLGTKTVRHVAADAEVDERTVERVLLGFPTRPSCRERVAAALEKYGLDLSTLVPGIEPADEAGSDAGPPPIPRQESRP